MLMASNLNKVLKGEIIDHETHVITSKSLYLFKNSVAAKDHQSFHFF